MKINKLKYTILSAVFFISSMTNNIFAQTFPHEPEGTPDPLPGETEGSIDQAMIWLLIAGIFAALYFLQTKRVAKTEK